MEDEDSNVVASLISTSALSNGVSATLKCKFGLILFRNVTDTFQMI